MKQSNLNFISRMPKPLLWMLAILIIIFLFFGIYSTIIYKEAMSSKQNGYSEAEKRVLSETNIKKIKETTTFSGEKTYYVVFGTDKENHKKIAFVPEKKEKIHVFDATETISKEQITTKIFKECPNCDKIRVKPGLLDNKLVWEASYLGEKNNYVFEYYSMKNASRYEKFQMGRNFK